MNIEEIYDISALRVIVRTIDECYQVLGVIHNLWRPIPGRLKDYIATPKPNGYQSIHTSIFTGDGSSVEFQIRTEQMQHEAEFGIASHWLYSEGKKKSWRDLIGFNKKNNVYQEKPDEDILWISKKMMGLEEVIRETVLQDFPVPMELTLKLEMCKRISNAIRQEILTHSSQEGKKIGGV